MDNVTLTSVLTNLAGFVVGLPVGALWGVRWARRHHIRRATEETDR